MPLFEYDCQTCEEYSEHFTDLDWRDRLVCDKCGNRLSRIMLTPPRLDPNMDTPSARQTWRENAERRARGADMTSANKHYDDESAHREAHAKRAARGETPIVVS